MFIFGYYGNEKALLKIRTNYDSLVCGCRKLEMGFSIDHFCNVLHVSNALCTHMSHVRGTVSIYHALFAGKVVVLSSPKYPLLADFVKLLLKKRRTTTICTVFVLI